MLGAIFSCLFNFDKKFCSQKVETLIRRRILRRLILVCTVCLCPIKKTLGLYGLKGKYDQEIPQSQTAGNPWHREEEPLNKTPGRQTN